MVAFRYEIRRARAKEIPLLRGLERRAFRRFSQIEAPARVPEDLTPLAELWQAYEAERVWVAVAPVDRLIGFAYASLLDGNCHLEETDVLPAFGRRGVGTALVRTVCAYARQAGCPAVTLTTFRDVPWNAPFYARLGFEIVDPDDLSPGLARAVRDEARRGLPVDLRVVMRLDLARGPGEGRA